MGARGRMTGAVAVSAADRPHVMPQRDVPAMSPDSDTTDGTIDVIAVNPRTGFVELAVLDDRDWPDSDAQARWLIAKLNLYIGYVFGGQMEREAEYSGRPVKFAVHFRVRPS